MAPMRSRCPDRAALEDAVARSGIGKTPRILHQAWLQSDLLKDEEMPGVLRAQVHRWRAVLPQWEHRLWTTFGSRSLWKTEWPELTPLFDNYTSSIEQADASRLLYLYVHGGVYADLDVAPCSGLVVSAGTEDEHGVTHQMLQLWAWMLQSWSADSQDRAPSR